MITHMSTVNVNFYYFFSGAGFPEPAGQERTIVRFQVSQQEGEGREQLFGIYRKKSGEEPPIRSPNNLQKKE